MTQPGDDPCLDLLRRDLVDAEVEAGVAAGLWRLVGLAWPMLTVAIRLDDGGEVGLRLAVDGYPRLAPAGQPWDLVADALLAQDRWPVTGIEPEVFRPTWSPLDGNAPYLACDRVGLDGHPEWLSQHQARVWKPTRTIGFYLREIHHRLAGAQIPAKAGR